VKKSLIPTTFYGLIGVFVVIVSAMVILGSNPAFRKYAGAFFWIVSWAIFFLLGVALIFFTIKEKRKGLIKKFLILTGFSAAGFFIGVLLHNFLYALGTVTNQIVILGSVIEAFHIIFFIIAVFLCPLGFLVGAIGSIVLFVKRKKGN